MRKFEVTVSETANGVSVNFKRMGDIVAGQMWIAGVDVPKGKAVGEALDRAGILRSMGIVA